MFNLFGKKRTSKNKEKLIIEDSSDSIFNILTIVDSDNDEKHEYITIMSLKKIKEKGLHPEAIVGEYFGDFDNLKLNSQNCKSNPVFLKFMHDVFSKHAKNLDQNITEAKKPDVNMLVLADMRNGQSGLSNIQDIIGLMPVTGNDIGDYTPNNDYLLFSDSGPMSLPQDLREVLLLELIKLYDSRDAITS